MRKVRGPLAVLVAFLLGSGATLLLTPARSNNVHAGARRAEIVLYSEPNFQGRELHVYGDLVDLPFEERADGSKAFWNDRIRSIVVVSGTWRLYQHGRMNTLLDDTPEPEFSLSGRAVMPGWSTLLSAKSDGPLAISAPEFACLGPDVSSIQLVSEENLPDWAY